MCQWFHSPYTVWMPNFFCAGLQNVAWVAILRVGGVIPLIVSLMFLAMKPHRITQTMPADVLNLRHCISLVLFTLLSASIFIYISPNCKCLMPVQKYLVTFGPPCILLVTIKHLKYNNFKIVCTMKEYIKIRCRNSGCRLTHVKFFDLNFFNFHRIVSIYTSLERA